MQYLLIAVVLLFAFGTGLIVAAERLLQPAKTARGRGLRSGLTLLGYALNLLGLLGLFVSLVGIPIAIAGIIVLAMVLVKRGVARQYSVLSTLAVAAERQMPLAPAMEAIAEETGGGLSRSARRAAELLKAGCTLPDALEQAGGLVPHAALAMIRVGCDTGSLAAAIREAADAQHSFEAVWSHVLGKFLYFCILLTLIVAIGMFMMWKIVPALEKIFCDFDVQTPAVTQGFWNLAWFCVSYWYLIVLLQWPLFLLVPYLVARYIGWTGLDLPGIGGFGRRFHSAGILRTLALVADRGKPFRGGFATLARSHPRASIRQRLGAVLRDVDAGADWAERLAAHGLIGKADRGVLQAAQRVGNLPWALREMAASSRRRLLYRVNGLTQVLFVVVIVGFGLLVLWFAVAFFLPLTALIRSQV